MVVHAYYPFGETRVEREARALVDHGYEVDVICLQADGEPTVDTEDGVGIYRLPVKRHKKSGLIVQMLEYLAFFVLVFVRLAALHRRRRYRVVQVHNLPDFLVFAALVPKLTGAQLILDLHDLMPEFYAARFGGSLDSLPVRLIRWQERLSCRFADHVITVTEPWRETLIQRGLPAEKITVVMNVADDRIFHRTSAIALSARNDDRFNLIYHGNLTRRYGIDLAIQAVNLVRQKIPEIHLTIHGWGRYLETLIELADELDLREHVYFSSRAVPAAELPQLIRKADVGVVPYRRDVFTDGILPTKLMEYAALGMPVIAARTPAITAYFDEKMVQFFTPEDPDDLARCILTLYSDRKRMEQLAEGTEKFNQRYNWTKLGAEYVALVERLGTR
jgi:glycosyltransferase involved in cell wall biosynthesis